MGREGGTKSRTKSDQTNDEGRGMYSGGPFTFLGIGGVFVGVFGRGGRTGSVGIDTGVLAMSAKVAMEGETE